jgi:outer membrane protein OmpA-like peptidoglycan-associated protein
MPRLARNHYCLGSVALVATLAAPALAQPAGQLAVDDFRPAMDARGYFTLDGSQLLDRGDLSFGLGSLEWGRHLLTAPGMTAVDNLVSATLVSAVGLELAGVPFELGAALPLTIVSGAGDGSGRVDSQGVGDLGLHAKFRIAHGHGLGLGAIASVYVPTSSAHDRLLGEPGVTPQLIGVADATIGRLRFAINGGVRLRPTSTLAMGTTAITSSTELPIGVGVAWALAPHKLELVGEVFGAIPIGDHHGYQPLEALGGLKLYLARNSYLALGAGRGLVPDQAGNPDFRAMIGIVFEPKPAERIAAHIPDDAVAFAPPSPPKDDFPDRDNDGIRDDLDKCPDEPENYNGVEDEDGCPDRDIVTDGGSVLVVLGSIDFEFDSAVLKPSASKVLDAVAFALTGNPDIKKVEVQGHTDERGDDDYNFDLSNRRAASVVAYLTKHGVDPGRLQSQGYGETRPIDPAHTEAAWAKNRRVEFIILKRE